MSTTPLFRSQAIDARASQVVGNILLRQPLPVWIAATVSLSLMVALGVYLWVGEYTRKIKVTGQIVPTAGAVKIVASQFGRVSHRPVEEGDVIKAGQVLYEITSERDGQQGSIDSQIEAAFISRQGLLHHEQVVQSRQLQQREKSLRIRKQLSEAEIARLDDEIALHKRRIANAEKMVARYRSLRADGFIAEIQLTQQENEYNEQLVRQRTLERNRLSLTREMLQIQEEADQTADQLKLIVAQTDRNLASLGQEMAEHQARRRIKILAPTAGTITTITAQPGQAVNAGTVLATILPAGSELEAQLAVPSRAMGFIENGQQVLVRLSAFPYQKFGQIGGVVNRVEQSPVRESAGMEYNQGKTLTEPMYRVTVKLAKQSILAYGREQPIRSGMSLEADIQQDRRKLMEWIIDPITGFGTRNGT